MPCVFSVSTLVEGMARDLAQDRAAIHDLILRYAALVRDQQGHDCAGFFTDDAVYEIREAEPTQPDSESRLRNRLEGAAAIAEYVGNSASVQIRIYPLIHNVLVALNGAVASTQCLMTTRTFPAGNEVFGRYDDSFACQDGLWLFTSRRYTILDAPWMRSVKT